jgi:putative ABC transport system permease protein
MNLLWRLAFRNLFRNKRRSLTTGIAIAAGFIGLSLLGAYIFRVQKGLQANTVYLNLQGHLQIHRKGALDHFSLSPRKYLITPEMDAAVDQVLLTYQNQIQFQARFLTGSGLIVSEKTSQPFVATGFEREVLLKALNHSYVQRWAKSWSRFNPADLKAEILSEPLLISVTPRLAGILGRPKDLRNLSQEQKDIQLITRTYYNDLNAVNAELGLLHTTGVAMAEDTSTRMPLKLLQELMATESYQYRSLFLVDGSRAQGSKKKIQADFDRQNLDLEVFHFTDGPIGEFYVGTMNFLYVMGSFFVFLICGMVALSIVNSLTLGILERTKELGTLKALGFSSKKIVGLFVRETIWLSVISIGFGIVISQIVARVVNASNIRFTPPGIEGDIQFTLDPEIFLYLLLALVLLAIAVATADRVSKKKMQSSAIELLSESGF